MTREWYFKPHTLFCPRLWSRAWHCTLFLCYLCQAFLAKEGVTGGISPGEQLFRQSHGEFSAQINISVLLKGCSEMFLEIQISSIVRYHFSILVLHNILRRKKCIAFLLTALGKQTSHMHFFLEKGHYIEHEIHGNMLGFTSI